MTTKNNNGIFVKPYSYNQCPAIGCSYEISVETPISEWPEVVKNHVNETHKGKSIWTKVVK